MAVFYVLPPRERLEHEITTFWERILPGLAAPPRLGDWFLERIERSHPTALFLHREDLPGGELVGDLVEYFGATPGDEVVEVGGSVRRTICTLE